MNIVEPILNQCKLNPYALAIHVPGMEFGSFTYGALGKIIAKVAETALRSGIAQGDTVATYINDPILNSAITLGLMYAGAATMSLREPKPIAGIPPDIILTNTPGKFSGDQTIMSVDRSWMESDGAAMTDRNTSHKNDDNVCRIILTSGSTGTPKGIAFSHKALAARIAHYTYSKGPRFAHCSRFFCDLGFATSPGFRYAMSLLSRGGTIYYLGPNPADILQTLDLHDIQGMATSPYGLGEFLRFFEADSAFDVTFDHIICQGAMLSRELSRRVRARMCQNLYSSYGSTETTTVAFGPTNMLEKTPGAVGYIQPGVIVEVLDGSGKILPARQDGLLRIRTDHMASEYVGDPEATNTFFRDGYFYPGDIGHLAPDGILVVTGREKTALNVGGDTVNPEFVEEIIASFPGVREAGVFASNNDLGISTLSALIVTTAPIDQIALRDHCVRKVSPSCVPVQFIVVEVLPRGGQGKLVRKSLPEISASHLKVG